MEYQIPQFIEIESKIILGLEFKQVVGFLIVFGFLGVLYLLLKPLAFFIIAFPVGAATITFMFVKVNGKNFFDFVTIVFSYLGRSQVYIWKREYEEAVFKNQAIDLSEVQIIKTHKHGESDSDAAKALSPRQVDQKIIEIASKLDSSVSSNILQ